jgi:hypothetical protein
VKNKYACKSERLRRYRNAIWDTMEYFSGIDLISIPREHNIQADKLAVSSSTLQPLDELFNGQGKIEINFRPSVPDNLDHWQAFGDDRKILNFIHNVQEFSIFDVSYKEEGKEYIDEDDPIKNLIPRELVALEQIFDRHDMHKKKKEVIKHGNFIEINIGTSEEPGMIKIGKGTSKKERK